MGASYKGISADRRASAARQDRKGLFGELDLGDKAEEVRKLLAATAQIIKLQRNQIRLLCELAGVVVNSAAGPNGLPIPKKKSNKEDTDECEAAD